MSMNFKGFNRPAISVAVFSLFLGSNSGCSEPAAEAPKAVASTVQTEKSDTTAGKSGKKAKVKHQVTSRRDREAGRRRGDPSVE